MNQIIEGIFRFIFVFIIATFLCWTGEIIITATTFGWHRPRWDGYKDKPPLKRVACEVGVGALGFIFWILVIPITIRFVNTSGIV